MTTKYFKALADETRLRILNLLLYHELNVNEIMNILQIGQSRISHHLKILSQSGLLASRRDGLWIFYSITNQEDGKKFVEAIAYLLESEAIFSQDLKKCRKTLDERVRATAKFFDSIAEDWEKMKQEMMGEFDLIEKIVDRLGKCNVAVDLGCGTGDLLCALLGKADLVIGVDNSPKMLEKARTRLARFHEKIDLRIGEMKHLPLKDGEADLAIVNMVLHHLTSPLDALKEAFRVLKKRGRFILADFEKHQESRMQTRYGDRWLGFTVSEVSSWLNQSGFKVKKVVQFPVKRNLKINVYDAFKTN